MNFDFLLQFSLSTSADPQVTRLHLFALSLVLPLGRKNESTSEYQSPDRLHLTVDKNAPEQEVRDISKGAMLPQKEEKKTRRSSTRPTKALRGSVRGGGSRPAWVEDPAFHLGPESSVV